MLIAASRRADERDAISCHELEIACCGLRSGFSSSMMPDNRPRDDLPAVSVTAIRGGVAVRAAARCLPAAAICADAG
jgi:hypothetical protein